MIMSKPRRTVALVGLAVFWAALAFTNGITLYDSAVHLARLITFALSAFLSGLFVGQIIMKSRLARGTKPPPQ